MELWCWGGFGGSGDNRPGAVIRAGSPTVWSSDCTIIKRLQLGRPLDFALLPFDHCLRKISGENRNGRISETATHPFDPELKSMIVV